MNDAVTAEFVDHVAILTSDHVMPATTMARLASEQCQAPACTPGCWPDEDGVAWFWLANAAPS